MGALRLLLARWRADRALLLLLAVVIAVTAGLVAAVPRLLDQLQRTSLEEELARVTADRRGLSADVVRTVRFDDVDGQWTSLGEVAGELEEGSVDQALLDVLDEPVPVVDSLRFALGPEPGSTEVDGLTRVLTVRSQLDLPPLEVLEGRLPDGDQETMTWTQETASVGDDDTITARVSEVVMTPPSAEAMGMAVGDRRVAVVDPEGPVARRVVPRPDDVVVVELVGLVELPPVEDPVWFGDARLHRPTQFDTNTSTTFFAHAVVPPDVAVQLPGTGSGAPASVTWRWQLDEEAMLAADPGPVGDAALTLRTTLSLDLDEPRWSSGLDRLLDREQERRATAVEVLSLAVVAVVGVAVALLGAVGAVLATRRRDALALVRGRGTSAAQALLASAVEAVGVAGTGTVVALGVLAALLPGGGGEGLAVAVGVVGVVVLVTATWADVTRPLGALLAERRRATGRRRVGRPVLEGLVVLVAVVAVVAVRQRGAVVDGVPDPLVVAAPAAVALATAVVAARVVPLALRVLGPLAVRGSRGLSAPLGVARATRQGHGGPVVLLVTLGVGVAAVSVAVQASLVRGQSVAAEEQVGADVRIAAPPLATLSADWRSPSPDDVVAEVAVTDGVAVGPAGGQSVDVVLVDAGDVAALVDDPALPSLVWDGVRPAPVVLSGPLPAAGDPGVGDELALNVDGGRVAVVVAGVRPRLLGIDGEEDGRFVVVEQEAVVAATGERAEPTVRLVRTDDVDAVVAGALDADPDAEVLVRDDVRASLAEAPLAVGVRVGFTVAAAVVVVATLLAVVLALAAAAPARRRQAAVLAAMGTSRGRIAAVAVAEVLPPVAVSAGLGLLLAVGVAVLLSGNLDLAAFTGTVSPTAVGPPPLVPAASLAVLVLVVASVAAVVTIGRVDTAALLREGD